MTFRLLVLTWALWLPFQVSLGQVGQVEPSGKVSAEDTLEIWEDLQLRLKDGEPAYTDEEAAAMIAELIPRVEAAAGRTFVAEPAHEIVDIKTVRRALAADLAPQLESLGQGLSTEDAEIAARAQARILAPLVLGKWGLTAQKIFLLPKRVKPLAALIGIDPEHEDVLVRMIIAHELVHALQDQETELAERFNTFRSVDRTMAFSAMMEGHAVFVAQRVGEELGLSEEQLEACTRLLSGAVSFGEPVLDMIGRVAQAQFEQIYMGGERFCAYHHAEGGDERLWEILDAPPTATSMIAHPETYSSVVARSLDLETALEGFEEQFGEGPWTVQNIEVGSLLLASVYAGMDEADREQILSQVTQLQTLLAGREGSPQIVGNVSLIRFRDPGFADTYLQLLRALTEVNVESMKAGGMVNVTKLEFDELEDFECDAGLLTLLQVAVGGETIDQCIYRVARDGVMVELIASGLDVDDAALLGMVEEAFRRHEQALELFAEPVGAGADR